MVVGDVPSDLLSGASRARSSAGPSVRTRVSVFGAQTNYDTCHCDGSGRSALSRSFSGTRAGEVSVSGGSAAPGGSRVGGKGGATVVVGAGTVPWSAEGGGSRESIVGLTEKPFGRSEVSPSGRRGSGSRTRTCRGSATRSGRDP